jgi:hypothetical protein
LISGVQTMMLKTYKGCLDPEEVRESIRDLGNLDKYLHNPKTGYKENTKFSLKTNDIF